jgi:hypothetical protein
MNRRFLITGTVVFIAGALLVYVSGLMNGPLENAPMPVFPFLYSLQTVWTLLGLAGIILLVLGIVLKEKGKSRKR